MDRELPEKTAKAAFTFLLARELQNVYRFAATLATNLVRPSVSVSGRTARWRAMQLAAISLVLFCLEGVGAILWLGVTDDSSQLQLVLASLAGAAVVYGLSRSRQFEYGIAFLTLKSFVMTWVWAANQPHPEKAIVIVITVFLSSLFYPMLLSLFIVGVNLFILLFVVGYESQYDIDFAFVTLFYLLLSVFILLTSQMQRTVERRLVAQAAIQDLNDKRLRESIEERERANRELTHSASLLRATLDSTADGILVVDSQENVMLYNQAFVSLWELPLGWENLGVAQWRSVVLEKIQDADAYRRRDAERRDLEPEIHDSIEMKDGRVLEVVIRPYRVQGKLEGRLYKYTDVTARLQAERQNLELTMERERADMLEGVMGEVSHDLLSTISAINTNLYIAEQSDSWHKSAIYVRKVQEQIRRLQSMLQDMQVMSQLDRAGEQEYELATNNLNDFVRGLVNEYQAGALLKNQTLQFSADDSIKAVDFDPEKLRRALANLLDNAIKYTGRGGLIKVKTDRSDRGVAITVLDTGVGIAAVEQERIFERFYRAEKTRKTERGSGLGLTIVKHIIEAHGGNVKVRSIEGEGSVFSIWLPESKTPLT